MKKVLSSFSLLFDISVTRLRFSGKLRLLYEQT